MHIFEVMIAVASDKNKEIMIEKDSEGAFWEGWDIQVCSL